MNNNKRAIIMAGGKGKRLRPYTLVLPKPLMPVGEFPILEIVIKQLSNYGFKHITLAVNHQASIIKAFFGNGEKWSIKIDYFNEENPLGTMGSIKGIKDLPENFLIMNGDVLTNLNFNIFYNNHIRNKSIFTISASKRIQKIDYGVLNINDKNVLNGFQEKPEINYLVSMGIYMANREIVNYIPYDFFGFDNLMHLFLEEKKNVIVDAFDGYWLDIGRPSDYEKAIEDLDFVIKNLY